MRRTLLFLLGVLLGAVLVIGADVIGHSATPSLTVALPSQGTVILFPRSGTGMIAGLADRFATQDACKAWLEGAGKGVTSDTNRTHIIIGECR